MRIVVALGGNALLERGEDPLAEIQEKHVAVAVDALAPLARDHDLVITHGNGPQVGLLANRERRAIPPCPHPYPLDVLGAQTQGMIGYFLLQAFENAAARPAGGQPDLPDRGRPRRPRLRPSDQVRRPRLPTEGQRWRSSAGGRSGPTASRGGGWWPPPNPWPSSSCRPSGELSAGGAIVVCAGGGGVPVVRGGDGPLRGVEAVVDKDLTAALLARQLDADALLILTDVANVESDFGHRWHVPSRTTTVGASGHAFPAGSMGPKVEAACRFVEATGKTAMIGRLEDALELIEGTRGTLVEPDARKDHPQAGNTPGNRA